VANTFTLSQTILFQNKSCSYEMSIYQGILKKCIMFYTKWSN